MAATCTSSPTPSTQEPGSRVWPCRTWVQVGTSRRAARAAIARYSSRLDSGAYPSIRPIPMPPSPSSASTAARMRAAVGPSTRRRQPGPPIAAVIASKLPSGGARSSTAMRAPVQEAANP
jgi:hypothetical protein